MSSFPGRELSIPLALVALASAPLGGGAVAPLVALLGLIAFVVGRRRLPARERNLVGLCFAVGVALLVVDTIAVQRGATAAASRAGTSLQGELAAWRSGLTGDLEHAAVALEASTTGVADRSDDFERLGRLEAPRRTFLLFDADGELVVWSGPGLLQRLDAATLRRSSRGFLQGALSATLYDSRSLPGPGGRNWLLAVGESFRRDGAPPGATGLPPGAAGWRLDAGADGIERVTTVAAPLGSPDDGARMLRRAATGSVALGFALLAVLRGSTLLLLTGAAAVPGRPRPSAVIAAAAVAAALAVLAAGADPLRVLAVGAGIALLGWVAGSHRLLPAAVRWLPAVAVGPLVVTLAGRVALRPAAEALSILGSGREAALRVAVGAFVFAAILSARGRRGSERSSAAVWAGLGLALAAGACLDRPLVVVSGTALAALLAASALPESLRSRPGRLAGSALLAMLLAGATWSSGAEGAQLRDMTRHLPTLLPPSDADLSRVERDVMLELRRIGAPILLREGMAAALPQDLALAIWSRTGLARRDALSTISVLRDDGEEARFSYGLPVDSQGVTDLSPVRWVDLDPPAWIARRIERTQDLEPGGAHRFRIHWALIPRPGFGPSPPRVTDLAAALLRGGAAQTALSELVPGAHAAIFDPARRPVVTPWIEGTPAVTPEWFSRPPFTLRVRTPDGGARLAAVEGEGVVAALFVQDETLLEALERTGTFAAGILFLCLIVGFAALVVVLPRGAVRDFVRRSLRSYSKRLVIVFSVLLLAPLLLLYGLFAHTLSRRLEREQETAALDAMRSAQRVLGEYVLSLDPGFGVGTALDDRLFEWLARVIHHEINLYWGSDVYASSKRDLFTAGLLPRRIPGRVWERIALAGERVAQREAHAGSSDYLELYAPLEVPGVVSQPTRLILALPLLAQQEELDAEADAVRRRALLATLALSLSLAALGSRFADRFTRPIEAIVAGTRRIADGAPGLDYRPDEVELEALADAIDRMAARIAESRERLLGEKRLVERIVDNVTAAVVGLDRHGDVLLANRLARDWLGVEPGRALSETLAARELTPVASALAAVEPAGHPVAVRIRTPNGARDWALIRVPLEGGEPAELLVIEDVTDVVRAQRLDAWLAMARIIAHEIKNPLTPIRLSAEHLREAWARDRTHFEEVFERCTENILAQVEELRRTASEFSLYSEIPRIEPRLEDLRRVVAEIVDAYRTAPPPGVELRYRAPGEAIDLSHDARLLGRALRNLIENAIRASAGGGSVEVRLERRDGAAAIAVLDEGAGVEPQLLERVLEPYFSTASGGTGLGLPIARRIAEEHGGTLTVRNREGGGFEATITIPLT